MDKGFFVLASYYAAVQSLPARDRGAMWSALMDYAFTGIEPQKLKSSLAACFALMRPTVDAAKKRKARRSNNAQPTADDMPDDMPTLDEQWTNNGQPMYEQWSTSYTHENQIKDEGQGTRDKGQGIKDKGQGMKDTLSPYPLSAEERDPAPLRSPATSDSELDWMSFWEIYPRKEAMYSVREAWDELAPDFELAQRIIRRVYRLADSEEWTRDGGRWVPRGDKWLRERRWLDELPEG